MVKRPRLSVRDTRSNGFLTKALSLRSACNPTIIPLTGSKSAAANTFPETSSVSMASPVEKEKHNYLADYPHCYPQWHPKINGISGIGFQ